MTFGERKSGQEGNNFIKLISNGANPGMTGKKSHSIHVIGRQEFSAGMRIIRIYFS